MKLWIIALVVGLGASNAHAGEVDVVDQRYIDQLTKGGNASIKQAAQSIYNTGNKDVEVLDVAAEVLFQRYPTAGKSDIDTLAWVCRAIGNSGNSRYATVLKEVSDSDAHSKLRKYCRKALAEVGSASGDQYTKGSVDTAALRASSASATGKPAPAKTEQTSSGEKQGLDVIVVGMSMQEVYDLVGQPTATNTHQTGKAWIPFNYGGKDLARTHLLYKGQGRVVCSHDAYSSSSRVLEVIIDPEETGYP